MREYLSLRCLEQEDMAVWAVSKEALPKTNRSHCSLGLVLFCFGGGLVVHVGACTHVEVSEKLNRSQFFVPCEFQGSSLGCQTDLTDSALAHGPLTRFKPEQWPKRCLSVCRGVRVDWCHFIWSWNYFCASLPE